jgi:hypothetical protein
MGMQFLAVNKANLVLLLLLLSLLCCCPYVCMQSATMRPTARYLQQHRFVVGQRPANASCLLPLIEKV